MLVRHVDIRNRVNWKTDNYWLWQRLHEMVIMVTRDWRAHQSDFPNCEKIHIYFTFNKQKMYVWIRVNPTCKLMIWLTCIGHV